MSDELAELGRRAVACKGWRWLAGMKTTHGQRMITGEEESRPCHPWPTGYLWVPDLSDFATLGCLLALVRSAWGVPDEIYVCRNSGGFVQGAPDGGRLWCIPLPAVPGNEDHWAWGRTEAEALVAALEAAP